EKVEVEGRSEPHAWVPFKRYEGDIVLSSDPAMTLWIDTRVPKAQVRNAFYEGDQLTLFGTWMSSASKARDSDKTYPDQLVLLTQGKIETESSVTRGVASAFVLALEVLAAHAEIPRG